MEPEITVYDNDNNQIGKTFARRAKQLVSKGRAVWVDDRQCSVVLIDGTDVSEVYPPNGVRFKDLREDEDWEETYNADDALRRLAKERVWRKRALWWHVSGIIFSTFFVFIFFLFATDGFWRAAPFTYFIFGVCYGMITVWGIWIFRQIAAVLNERAPRFDKVEKEFRRLKSMHIR